MKRTELRRTAPLRRVSPGRARQNRAYTVLRREFLEAHPACEFPGCGRAPTDVHHKRGRVGALLLAVEHWAALCREHHSHLTVEPAEAYALGLSEHRIGAA